MDGPPAAETTGTETGSTDAAASLVNVVVPTEIASTCATRNVPATNAVETDVCTTPENAPTSRPDEFELSFYRSGDDLEAAYQQAKSGLKPARCGASRGRPGLDPHEHRTDGRSSILLHRRREPVRRRLDTREARLRGPRRHPGHRARAGPRTHDVLQLVEQRERLPRQVPPAGCGAHLHRDHRGADGTTVGAPVPRAFLVPW